MVNYNAGASLNVTWTYLKTIVADKNISMQYFESATTYEIFAVDGNIVYFTRLFLGTVPDAVNFDQTTNDNDKTDFETNFQDITTNKAVAPNVLNDGDLAVDANPVVVAGSDGTNIRTVKTDSSGQIIAVGAGVAGTPSGGVVSVQGVSGGTPMPISGTITATNPSVGTNNSAVPTDSTLIGGSDGTNLQAARVYDTDSGAGSQYTLGVSLRKASSGGSVELGTSGDPIRVDPTGTTAQPITDNGGSLTVDGTVTANAGTGNFTVVQATAASLNATVVQTTASNLNATVVQSTAANLRSQTASESTTAAATGTVASLTGGAVTTAAPTYTTGQMNPLSLTTAGSLRVDGSGSTQPVSGTVTANAGTGNFTVVQATASNLNAQVQGAGANGAAVTGNPVLTAGSDGTNARTIKTLSDGSQVVKNREVATFTALSTSTAPANNKSMWSILNAAASGVTIKIQEIYLVNVQTTAVAGVVITFELRRITGHSVGTAITAIEEMETTDALDADVTVRTNSTVAGESATLLWRNLWSSDEWSTGTLDIEGHGHAFQTMFPIYVKKTLESKPITLLEGQGLTLKCATNTTVGSFDIMVVFTQE